MISAICSLYFSVSVSSCFPFCVFSKMCSYYFWGKKIIILKSHPLLQPLPLCTLPFSPRQGTQSASQGLRVRDTPLLTEQAGPVKSAA